MKRGTGRTHSPINFTLELFGDPWSLLIVRDMVFSDKRRFKEFLDSEERIATNVLVDRLARLQQNGIIEKMCEQYLITEKGLDLLPLLTEMIAWGAKYDPKTAIPKRLARLARTNPAKFRRELKKMGASEAKLAHAPKRAPPT